MTKEHNLVHLIGHLGSGVEERELPSGDRIVTFTVVVPRLVPRDAPKIDAIACQVRTQALRARILRMQTGDPIEVHGWLQRRFWRSATGLGSATEVVVTAVHRPS
jgi:single-strand DNA-binding protein